jgi:hypothetical protein
MFIFYRSQDDTSNFSEYPDSDNEPEALSSDQDPFLEW